MTKHEPTAPRPRFVALWRALLVLLISYPYFPKSAMGSFAGGLMSLVVLVAALRAVHRERRVFAAGLTVALLVMSVDILSYVWHRGHVFVEASFVLFYA